MGTWGITDPYASMRDPNTPGQQQNNSQSGASGSLQNAAVQSTGKAGGSSNPFESMLTHATAFNQAKNTVAASPTGQPIQNAQTQTPAGNVAQQYGTPQPKQQTQAAPGTQSFSFTPDGGGLNRVDDPSHVGGGGGGVPPTQPPMNPWTGNPGNNQPPPQGPPKPAGTEDPQIAADWYKNWIPEITAQDVTDYRNWSLAQQQGRLAGENMDIATWYTNYRRNKPTGTENPAVAADWYRTYTGFGEVTDIDVTNFRNWAIGTGNQNARFEDWYLKMGRPTLDSVTGGGNQPPWDPTRYGNPENISGGGAPTINPNEPPGTNEGNPQLPNEAPTEQPPVDPNVAPAPPQIPHLPPPTQETPFAGGEKQEETDLLGELRKMLDPSFNLESDRLNKVMRAQAALDGSIDSGGFGESLGSAQSQLAANQGSRLTDYTMKANQAELDRKQQFALAKMQDDLARYGIDTNEKLQKYLQQNELELKKYGIDKEDLWQRYQAELQLKGAEIGASAQLQGAQLMAAGAASAGAAQAAAAQRDGDIRLQLGLAGLDVERENNYWRTVLGMGGLNIDILKIIGSMSPDQSLGQFPFFPGGFTGKP
jgi:hypothetical protein